MKNLFVILVCLFILSNDVFSQSGNSIDNTPYRVGKWLPSDHAFLNDWIVEQLSESKAKNAPLLPVVQEFKDLIENDPELYMLFHQMFEQIPDKEPYKNDPTGKPQVKDYRTMLKLLNHIMHQAPEFNKTGLVGFPINAILDWPMGTEAGYAAFTNAKVNKQLKKILNEWALFLSSEDSRYVLSEDPKNGWFGKDAKEAMPNFEKKFICDPDLPYYGFASWDDFFTRQFREGVRPVANPDDDNIIANSCESAPYRIEKNVKKRDKFWIKAQP